MVLESNRVGKDVMHQSQQAGLGLQGDLQQRYYEDTVGVSSGGLKESNNGGQDDGTTITNTKTIFSTVTLTGVAATDKVFLVAGGGVRSTTAGGDICAIYINVDSTGGREVARVDVDAAVNGERRSFGITTLEAGATHGGGDLTYVLSGQMGTGGATGVTKDWDIVAMRLSV